MKGAGGLVAGSALAGCIGGDDGSGGDGGDGTPQIPEVDAVLASSGGGGGMNSVPMIAAMLDMMPQITNGRQTGSNSNFPSSSTGLQALIAGEIDYYGLSPGNVFRAQLAGAAPVVLAVRNGGSDYLFVANTNECDVENPKELFEADCTIGHAGLGGLSHIQIAGVMAREGFDPQGEEMTSKLVEIGGSGARTSAVAAGRVGATIIHIDQFDTIKGEGAPVRNLGELSEYFPSFVAQTNTVRSRWLEDSDTELHAENFVKAHVTANKLATENFEWIYEKTQKFNAAPIDEESARASWELNANVIETWPYTEEGHSKENYQNVIDVLTAGGVLSDEDANAIDLDALINRDYYLEAVDWAEDHASDFL